MGTCYARDYWCDVTDEPSRGPWPPPFEHREGWGSLSWSESKGGPARLTIPPREKGSCPVVGQTVSHYRILAGWPSFSRSLRKGWGWASSVHPRDKGHFRSQREIPSGRRPWNPLKKEGCAPGSRSGS